MTLSRRATRQIERFSQWGPEHGPAVRAYLLAMVRQSEVADDLLQDVFCRAWQAREAYREQGSARAYLLRIADRLLVDRGRKSGREVTLDRQGWRRIEPASHSADPADAAEATEAAETLSKAMDHLTPIQRRVLLLRYYGAFRFAEIAELIGCPLGTVLSHAHRGLGRLREVLLEGSDER